MAEDEGVSRVGGGHKVRQRKYRRNWSIVAPHLVHLREVRQEVEDELVEVGGVLHV
jgi:hypothetical protein